MDSSMSNRLARKAKLHFTFCSHRSFRNVVQVFELCSCEESQMDLVNSACIYP